MVASMTGYGRGFAQLNGREITVEIKSVNSRYFEYSSRLPRNCNFMEDKFKKLLSTKISRGKTELFLTIQSIEADKATVCINFEVAKAYYEAVNEISREFKLENKLSADKLLDYPDVLVVGRALQDEKQLWDDVEEVTVQALDNFTNMRLVEGQKLKEDILSRIQFMEKAVSTIEQTNSTRFKLYYDKLYARLLELLEDKNIDNSRIVQEAAIFSDKTAVDEETVRLRSHISQYKDILGNGGQVGRKLDFLTQELNREINTIGSKVQELELTKMVVEMKSEAEKIREQIQNLE